MLISEFGHGCSAVREDCTSRLINKLILLTGTSVPIAASVTELDVDQHSHLKLSTEGGLASGNLGKKRLLVEMGISAGISKVADDTYQLIMEAIVSTAPDASMVGTTRLIGFGFSCTCWLTRRGRDVMLPRYTIFTVRFDCPPAPSPSTVAP